MHAKAGLICSSIFALLLAINLGNIVLGFCLIAFQCGSTLFFRSMGMYLQSQIPEDKLGSWWTASDAFERIFGLLGIVLGGYFFDYVGGASFGILLGTCMFLSVIGLLLKPSTVKISAMSVSAEIR